MGVILDKPPFNLVQLSTVPKDKWIGLAVFHPLSQVGNKASWNSNHLVCKFTHGGSSTEQVMPLPQYDVGVIISFKYDDLARMQQVSFVGACGSVLRYAETNLWVIDSNNSETQPHEEIAIERVEYVNTDNDE